MSFLNNGSIIFFSSWNSEFWLIPHTINKTEIPIIICNGNINQYEIGRNLKKYIEKATHKAITKAGVTSLICCQEE